MVVKSSGSKPGLNPTTSQLWDFGQIVNVFRSVLSSVKCSCMYQPQRIKVNTHTHNKEDGT